MCRDPAARRDTYLVMRRSTACRASPSFRRGVNNRADLADRFSSYELASPGCGVNTVDRRGRTSCHHAAHCEDLGLPDLTKPIRAPNRIRARKCYLAFLALERSTRYQPGLSLALIFSLRGCRI